MSERFKQYCHDFQDLMFKLGEMVQTLGFVKLFKSKVVELISTEEGLVSIVMVENKAVLRFSGPDMEPKEITVNHEGRVPLHKFYRELCNLWLAHPVFFKLMLVHFKEVHKGLTDLTAHITLTQMDVVVGGFEKVGRSNYLKLADADLGINAPEWLSLWTWLLCQPEVGTTFNLDHDETVELTSYMACPRSRNFRETFYRLGRGDEDHYFVSLRHETIHLDEVVNVYDHLEPKFWVDQNIDTASLIRTFFKP